MNKSILVFALFFGCIITGINSQNQLLTIQDAVWKGRTGLAPKRLQALSFIPDSKKIAYIEKNELIVLNAETGKTVSTLSTINFNKNLISSKLDTVAVFEGIRWISENQF